MKKSICLATALLALNLSPVFGQAPGTIILHNNGTSVLQTQPPVLTKFNLDFPGGTPVELVRAIQNATGKPLNAIIPTEDAGLKIPPLKMSNVFVPQLFAALQGASRQTVAVSPGAYGNNYSIQTASYGFNTADSPITDTSIWYFHAEKPNLPPLVSTTQICQFYSLSPYLDRGFTVDDITTAIQTGWKMSDETPTPELSYHKETKMLIAYGEPDKLKTINDVLKTLPTPNEDYWGKHWQETQNTLLQLQGQINVLRMRISAPTTNSAPVEKSGK